MKAIYFDCASGIAGNMILGALISAGMPLKYLEKELYKLKLSNYKLQTSSKYSGATKAIHLVVLANKNEINRNINDILDLINKSKLKPGIKALSSAIFKRLALAESKVHRIPINKVHFHEVGAVDAIIDIVGCAIGLDYFGIEEAFCSAINVGSGKINHAHGILPIPAPATQELLKGVPIYDSGIKKELATPTGAAILTSIVKSFGPMPRIKVEKVGFGAGGYPLKVQPNFLKIIIGEKDIETEKDAVLLIETNIDDMNPKLWDKVIAKLMQSGAYDAYIEPIRMKKQRLAVKLSVICPIEIKDKILEIVFRETTSFGIRVYLVQREKLSRKYKTVKTKYGKAKVKIGFLGKEITTIAPEFEDYKKLAEKHSIPIKTAYKEALKALRR